MKKNSLSSCAEILKGQHTYHMYSLYIYHVCLYVLYNVHTYTHTPHSHTPTPTPTPTPTYKKTPCRAASQNFTQDTSSTTEGCPLYVTRDSIFFFKWYIYGGADFSDFSECISGPVLHHSSVSHLCTRKVNILGR